MAIRKYFISKDRLRQIIENQDKLIKKMIDENDSQRKQINNLLKLIEKQDKMIATYEALSSASDIKFPNTEKEGGFNS